MDPLPVLEATALDGSPAASQLGGQAVSFTLLQRVERAHLRLLWGISWSSDDSLLATASRDSTIKLWTVTAGVEDSSSNRDRATLVSTQPSLILPPFPAAVTAVAFAPQCTGAGAHILAVGLESGQLGLWVVSTGSDGRLQALPRWHSNLYDSHAGAVTAIRWRPLPARQVLSKGSSIPCLQFASSSEDHSVRVFAAGWGTL